MGEGFVQKGGGRLAKATVQGQSRFIPPLQIGASVIAIYKQEEPPTNWGRLCEGRLSCTVP